MKIVGLKVERYIGETINGYNCDFQYESCERERHILYGINSNGDRVRIALEAYETESASSWCVCEEAKMEVTCVRRFEPFTHVPVKELDIEDVDWKKKNWISDIKNDVFEYSSCGGDPYYPDGYYNVNMDLFKPIERSNLFISKRPVWIMKGRSGVGKTTLAMATGLSMYETDANKELPDAITADVVVVGNRYPHTVEDVIQRLFGNAKPIIVEFKEV